MSKIKKITAIRKKWIEKGNRLDVIELNPHSNGLDFCQSWIVFFLRYTIITRINIIIIIITIKCFIDNEIIYFLLKLLSWKLSILFILNKYIYLPHQ